MIVVGNRTTQDHFSKVLIYNFSSLKKYKKGYIERTKKIYLETFEKCPGSLYFPLLISCVRKKISKILTINNICINDFCYENKLTFPIYISDQKLKNSMDLLHIIDKSNSHYVYIKDIDKFIFYKRKDKNKKYLCKICLQCLSSKNVL